MCRPAARRFLDLLPLLPPAVPVQRASAEVHCLAQALLIEAPGNKRPEEIRQSVAVDVVMLRHVSRTYNNEADRLAGHTAERDGSGGGGGRGACRRCVRARRLRQRRQPPLRPLASHLSSPPQIGPALPKSCLSSPPQICAALLRFVILLKRALARPPELRGCQSRLPPRQLLPAPPHRRLRTAMARPRPELYKKESGEPRWSLHC